LFNTEVLSKTIKNKYKNAGDSSMAAKARKKTKKLLLNTEEPSKTINAAKAEKKTKKFLSNKELPTLKYPKNAGSSSPSEEWPKKLKECFAKLEEESKAGIFSPEVLKRYKVLAMRLECQEDINEKMKDIFNTLLDKWTIGAFYGKNNLDNIINYISESAKLGLQIQKNKVQEILSIASESDLGSTMLWCKYLINRANKIYTNIAKLWEYRWPIDNFELEQQDVLKKFLRYFSRNKPSGKKRTTISLKKLYEIVEPRLKDDMLDLEEFKQVIKAWSIIENHAYGREDVLNANYGFSKEEIERIQELPMSDGGRENAQTIAKKQRSRTK
jgi:hypothetical protein